VPWRAVGEIGALEWLALPARGANLRRFQQTRCYPHIGPLPVHPLQLYLAAVGLILFVGLAAYRSRKRDDGEVLLLFGVGYLYY
jgi:prolipoprotein diacylglyceryltransferase